MKIMFSIITPNMTFVKLQNTDTFHSRSFKGEMDMCPVRLTTDKYLVFQLLHR